MSIDLRVAELPRVIYHEAPAPIPVPCPEALDRSRLERSRRQAREEEILTAERIRQAKASSIACRLAHDEGHRRGYKEGTRWGAFVGIVTGCVLGMLSAAIAADSAALVGWLQ